MVGHDDLWPLRRGQQRHRSADPRPAPVIAMDFPSGVAARWGRGLLGRVSGARGHAERVSDAMLGRVGPGSKAPRTSPPPHGGIVPSAGRGGGDEQNRRPERSPTCCPVRFDLPTTTPPQAPLLRRGLELTTTKHRAAYVKGRQRPLELAAARDSGEFSESIVGLQRPWRSTCRATSHHTRSSGPASPTAATSPRAAPAIIARLRLLRRLQGQLTAATTTVQGSGWASRLRPDGRRLFVEQVATTTRATSARARRRCSCSTPGSTPSTCSTRT